MSEAREERRRQEQPLEEGFGEKWARDPVGSAVGALVLIWLGVCFLMVTSGSWEWENVWGYFLGGFGVIVLLEVVIRLVLPAYRRPIVGRLILALVLMAVGFGGMLGLETWWPLVVIIIGLAMLVGVLTRTIRP